MTSQKELIPMLPGDILRYERQQAGLSLERAAESARIRVTVLEAIENGATQDIPSVYLKGYIRNYARFLGIDPAGLEEHMCQLQGTDPAVRSVFTVPVRRGHTERWLKASSYLAASLLMAALAWQFTHEAVRFSQGESQLATAPDSSAAPRPETGPSANRAGTHLNASIAAMEMLQEETGSAAPATEQGRQSGAGEAAPFASGAGWHSLHLQTSADTWVEIVDGSGRQLEQDLIRAGDSRDYRGTGPLQVMVGRASAVDLLLDGEAVDLGPHTRGNVARLSLGAALVAEEKSSGESLQR